MPDPSFATICVHGSAEGSPGPGLVAPIHQCAVFAYDDEEDSPPTYPRLGNVPTQQALAEKLARLEGADAALVFSSGMAAISTSLLALLTRGGHVLVQRSLYGGTHRLLTETLGGLGTTFSFVDENDPESWRAALRPNTRAFYTEAIANPTMAIADHAAVVDFAREHRLCALIDATFTSPYLFRPLELGYHVVVHSATKFLNGHSDLVAGVVAASGDYVAPLRTLQARLGGTLDPLGCFLLDRGLKTLPLRVERQQHNALALARTLAPHRAVRKVNYAGLPESPLHARAAELFDGCGGMLSFEIDGGTERARRFLSGLRLVRNATSLGGVETVVARPVARTHRDVPPAERAAMGISDGLIRVSAGIEDTADLIRDFENGLAAC
jgi:cystathionine gamma-synthase/cystathionine gamma-lyase/cystathionine beta-lyase